MNFKPTASPRTLWPANSLKLREPRLAGVKLTKPMKPRKLGVKLSSLAPSKTYL